jgi:hypothetical protein
MTVAHLSPAHQDAVGPGLKGLKDMDGIDSTRAGEFYDPHIVGILQSHGPGHIGGCIGAIGAYHGHDSGIEGVCMAFIV